MLQSRRDPSHYVRDVSSEAACIRASLEVKQKLFGVLVLDDRAAFHYEFHVLQCGDVLCGVAVDGDDVCPFAGFEGADFGGPAQEIGGVDGCGLDGLRGSHAECGHRRRIRGR